jgi:signal transduction histidine kinase
VSQEPRARRLRSALWAFLFWTAIGLFFAMQLRFAGLSWSVAIEWSLPRWYSWGLLAPLVFRIDRRLVESLRLAGRIALHLPLAIAWTTLAILIRLAARPIRGAEWPADFSAFFFERFYPDLVIYAVIATVSMVRGYAGHMREREQQAREQATRLERELARARLHSLRAQLQPHFLFNALNTMSALTESNPRLARQLMGQLGDLLRASLTHSENPLVPLGEELTFLDDYLAIETARFEGRVAVAVDADDNVLELPVPSFLLQPLVENAFRHGVAPRLSGGHIDVTATRDDGMLRLRVRDDGLGLPSGWHLDRDMGIGLSNLRSRLAQLYNRTDLLHVKPGERGGVNVEVRIPIGSPPGPPTIGRA